MAEVIDLHLAEKLLHCCQLSYLDDVETIEASEWYAPSGLSEVQQFTTADREFSCIVGRFVSEQVNPRRVIAFRGTEPSNAMDWLTDAEAMLVPWGKGLVHCGFHKAFSELMPMIAGFAEEAMIVTGHSLGGACCTIFADFERRCHPLVATFGSPRVGDTVFADDYDSVIPESWRFCNAGDPVTDVPLPLLYEHVSNLVLLGSNELITIERHYLSSYLASVKSIQ